MDTRDTEVDVVGEKTEILSDPLQGLRGASVGSAVPTRRRRDDAYTEGLEEVSVGGDDVGRVGHRDRGCRGGPV